MPSGASHQSATGAPRGSAAARGTSSSAISRGASAGASAPTVGYRWYAALAMPRQATTTAANTGPVHASARRRPIDHRATTRPTAATSAPAAA